MFQHLSLLKIKDLMAKNKVVRFAVGNVNNPFSRMLGLVVSKNDVYIGTEKSMAKLLD